MLSYDDFVKLALCYADEARKARKDPERARGCWRMALHYQKQAARVAGGKPPEIGKKPPHITDKMNDQSSRHQN